MRSLSARLRKRAKEAMDLLGSKNLGHEGAQYVLGRVSTLEAIAQELDEVQFDARLERLEKLWEVAKANPDLIRELAIAALSGPKA